MDLFDEEDLGFFIGPHINSIGRLCSNKYIHQLVESISQDELWAIKKQKFSLITEEDAYNIAHSDEQIAKFIELLMGSFFPIDINEEDKKSFKFIEYMGVLMMNLNVIRKQRQKILSDEIAENKAILAANKKNAVFCFYSSLQQSFLGIVGIVAAKVSENYHKPSFIGVVLGDKVKGSIRSIEGVNVGLMMIAAKEAKIVIDGGGHSKAGGFTVYLEKWDEFVKFCHEFTGECLKNNQKKKTIYIDYIMSTHGVNYNLFKDIQTLKPFGEGNPKLNFLLINCSIARIMIIKKCHLMISIEMEAIGYNKKNTLTGWIFFFDKNKKFIDLLAKINDNHRVNADFVVNVSCDQNVYILDYKINDTVPKNFINKKQYY